MRRRNFLKNISLFTGGSVLPVSSYPTIAHQTGKISDYSDNKTIKRIAVTAPSSIGVNENFWIGIRILTEPYYARWIPQWQRTGVTVDGPFNHSSRGTKFMDNVMPEWKGTVHIMGSAGFRGRDTYSFTEGAGPYQRDKRPVRRLENFSFNTPGIKYIRVVDPVSGIEGISNPIHVDIEAPKERLFWAELHCHSFFGDGIRNPEEIHSFARDESFLDIFALTDHVEALSDAQWNYFREVANTFNEPQRFVSFIGGEWTSSKFGHHGFLYPGSEGPILRCTDPDQDTLEKIYAIAKQHGAMIIANHPAEDGWGFDWNKGHNDNVERLVEVYSIGGAYDTPAEGNYPFPSRRVKRPSPGNFVIDGLKKGFRLGMIGVGDVHDGRPGDALHQLQEEPQGYKELLGPGLTGVWAKELTREAVFEALRNRRVFATTNNRTWLKFSINEHPMGSEFKAGGKLNILVEAASDRNIQRIELFKEGNIIQYYEPKSMHVTWKPTDRNKNNSSWYFVRLWLEGEHLAWSSPIWVNTD